MAQYADFRLYTISRLPQLRSLDGSAVTDAEREAAVKAYGSVRLSVKSVSYVSAPISSSTRQGSLRAK